MAFRGHGWISESWWSSTIPTTGPTGTTAIWQGLKFGIETDGIIEGFRAFIPALDDGNYWGVLWDFTTKELIRALQFRMRADTSINDWHQCWILPRIKHTDVNRNYYLAILYPVGKRFFTSSVLGSPVQHGNITFVAGFTSTALAIDLSTPTLNTNAPGIDILFHAF